PFILCLALFAMLSPTASVAGKGFGYAAGLLTKPVGGLFALSSGSQALDTITVLVVIGFGGWLVATHNVVVSRPLAFATAAMALAFVVVPPTIMGALYADVRLAPALALLAIATLDIRPGAPVWTQRSVTYLAVAVALLRAFVFTTEWRA